MHLLLSYEPTYKPQIEMQKFIAHNTPVQYMIGVGGKTLKTGQVRMRK